MSKIFKLGVIGNPIEHSLSPFIHSRFARKEGLNLDYKAYRVEQGDFNDFISEFFSDKYAKGLNCLLYTSPSPRDGLLSRMPSSA